MTKIISTHSFRGGTGKSNVTANIAAVLAQKGYRVGVFDTDIQSPGIHIIFHLTENDIRFGCVTLGPGLGLPKADGVKFATIVVYPEPDMRYRIRATKDNGVVRRLLDENCEIADIYGDIFPGTFAGLTPDCTDVDITVRRLEGDVDMDCDVDIIDSQLMNYRFQAFFGSLSYDIFYDLEPWPTGDYDIDVKDLQFVNGRVGSTCEIRAGFDCAAAGMVFLGDGAVCAAGSSGCCIADFDHNAVVSPDDLFGFVNAWLMRESVADADMNGLVSFNDLSVFISGFVTGCP